MLHLMLRQPCKAERGTVCGAIAQCPIKRFGEVGWANHVIPTLAAVWGWLRKPFQQRNPRGAIRTIRIARCVANLHHNVIVVRRVFSTRT